MKSLNWSILLLILFIACETVTEPEIDCKSEREGDVLLYASKTDESVLVDIHSKLEEELQGQIRLELFDFAGNSLGTDTVTISLEPMEDINYLDVPLEDINFTSKDQNVMLAQFESTDGSQRSSDLVFFMNDDELDLSSEPDIKIDIQPIISGYKVQLRCDVLVKNVKLSFPVEGTWSDNCFVLLPGKLGEYYFSIPEYTPDLEDSLEIEYLN